MNLQYDDWDKKVEEYKRRMGFESGSTNSDSSIQFPLTSGYLHKDLIDYKINSFESYIKQKSGLEKNKILKYTSSENIEIDREDRIYDPYVIFQRRVFDIDKLTLRDSKEIKFLNCIFRGNIEISSLGGTVDLNFDSCIFLGKVVIYNIQENGQITLNDTSCKNVLINEANLEILHLNNCNIFHLSLIRNKIEKLETFSNQFDFLEIVENDITLSDLHYSQINIDNINSSFSSNKYKKLHNKFNHFKISKDTKEDKSSSYNELKSIEYLLKHSNSKHNRVFYSSLLQAATYYSQKTWLGKVIIKIFSGFIKPFRVFTIAVCLLAIFALIYLFPIFQFKIGGSLHSGLDFSTAIYFSGITFTTIGYGDIAPVGYARFVAIFEGAVGILLSSCFLISFIRRYID